MTTFITKEGKFKAELKRRIEMLMTYLDPLHNIVKRQLAFQMTNKWLIAFFFQIVKHLHGTISNFLKADLMATPILHGNEPFNKHSFELKSPYTRLFHHCFYDFVKVVTQLNHIKIHTETISLIVIHHLKANFVNI